MRWWKRNSISPDLAAATSSGTAATITSGTSHGCSASRAPVMPRMATSAPASPTSPSTICHGRNWPPIDARSSRLWNAGVS